MDTRIKGAAAVATAAGVGFLRKVLDKPPSGWSGQGHGDPQRWRAVTVNVGIDKLSEDPPGPLAALGDAIEVRISPAPADKGTELAARLTGDGRGRIDGEEPLEALRRALRETKQLLEVGWVLSPDENTTTRPTPLNAPLRSATSHARGEGRL
jgi:hypothetical protein